MRMRHWRRISYPVQMVQSSPTRSMSNRSWLFNKKKALGAMRNGHDPQEPALLCVHSSVEERLRQTTGQTLATWTIGPGATFPEEVASGQALS